MSIATHLLHINVQWHHWSSKTITALGHDVSQCQSLGREISIQDTYVNFMDAITVTWHFWTTTIILRQQEVKHNLEIKE